MLNFHCKPISFFVRLPKYRAHPQKSNAMMVLRKMNLYDSRGQERSLKTDFLSCQALRFCVVIDFCIPEMSGSLLHAWELLKEKKVYWILFSPCFCKILTFSFFFSSGRSWKTLCSGNFCPLKTKNFCSNKAYEKVNQGDQRPILF